MAGPAQTTRPNESPLSLRRLRDAFAAMLKPQDGCDHLGQAPYGGSQPTQNICEPNPRSIVEAMLFVGRPDDGTFSARELAAAMRGVSPGEIDAAVSELNSIYDQDQSPYAIVGSPQGYRLALRGEFQRVRDKYLGKIREARLTPAALEVLSVVAYNQPIPAEAINQIRGRPSGAVLATLVRRRLVRQVAPQASGSPTNYVTTDRFLRLFNLESLAALPRSEDLEAA